MSDERDGGSPAVPVARGGVLSDRTRRFALGAVGTLAFLGLWEALARAGSLGLTVAPVSKILPAIGHNAGLLGRSAAASVSRAAEGYAIGVSAAFLVGVLILLLPRLDAGIYRLAVVVNAIPVIAFGSLVEVVGLQSFTPMVFAAMLVFLTTLIAVTKGFHSGSAATHDVLSTLGASRWERLVRLQLPDAVPSIADGLRIAAPTAFVGALLGEWFGAERGLGVLLINAMRNFDVELMWASALVAVAISALAYGLLGGLETLLVRRFSRTVQTRGVMTADMPDSRSRAMRALSWPARFWAVGLVILAWQLWISLGHVDRIVAPGPWNVATYVAGHPGTYLVQGLITAEAAIGGLVLGMAAGLILAVAAWLSPTLSGLIAPGVLVIPTVPIVVIIPVVARLIGFNRWTVVTVAVLLSFFPVFVLATSGLRYRPAGADDVFAAFGASRLRRLRYLALPSAVPNLLTAVRISAAACFLGALVAEWLVGTSGLGVVFRESRALLQPERAWGAIVVGVVVSVAAYLLAYSVEIRGRERWS
jgi:ABC-type nitrate/sulfonate/bicarbonate transport system permease component